MPGDSHEVAFTVFTPTHDRGHLLHRVYASLCAQTYDGFEWLVIDNASTDGTDRIVADWAREAAFPVRYVRNEQDIGFHGSWRRAIELARGRFFIYARSADELVPTALERLKWHWDSIPEDRREGYSAVTGLAVDEHGRLSGSPFPSDVLDSDSIEVRFRYKVTGEKFGFQRTDVLREMPMPTIPGFVGSIPPSILWRAIARRYRTRYVNEVLRVYWQDQGVTLSNPELPWSNAPGRLLAAEDTLDHDLRWFSAAPIAIFREAVAFVTSSLHVGRGLGGQWRRLRNAGARMIWLGALPAGSAFYLLQSRAPGLARRLPSP